MQPYTHMLILSWLDTRTNDIPLLSTNNAQWLGLVDKGYNNCFSNENFQVSCESRFHVMKLIEAICCHTRTNDRPLLSTNKHNCLRGISSLKNKFMCFTMYNGLRGCNLVNINLHSLRKEMVFCYQNCSDLL